jgi:hypothetical protein
MAAWQRAATWDSATKVALKILGSTDRLGGVAVENCWGSSEELAPSVTSTGGSGADRNSSRPSGSRNALARSQVTKPVSVTFCDQSAGRSITAGEAMTRYGRPESTGAKKASDTAGSPSRRRAW